LISSVGTRLLKVGFRVILGAYPAIVVLEKPDAHPLPPFDNGGLVDNVDAVGGGLRGHGLFGASLARGTSAIFSVFSCFPGRKRVETLNTYPWHPGASAVPRFASTKHAHNFVEALA
jgi:hypothetical protein